MLRRLRLIMVKVSTVGDRHLVVLFMDPRASRTWGLGDLSNGLREILGLWHRRGLGDLSGLRGIVAQPGERLPQRVDNFLFLSFISEWCFA